MFQTILTFLRAHGVVLTWPAVGAALLLAARYLLNLRTPEQWVALGERSPRLQGLLRFARGAGLDPVKALQGIEQMLTGVVTPDSALRAAELAIENAALRAALARLGASPSTVIEAAAVGRTPSTPNPQSGRAALSALLALVVGLTVVLPLGVALMGCPKLPPVSGCAPMSQRCSPAGAPEVCSSSQRWEPAGDLSCTAAGGVCVVGDGGIAHCAPAQDGGVR